MGWESNNVFQVLIITGSTGSGVFVYSPSPAFGKLVASVTAGTGTDIYGNAYLAGVTAYAPSIATAVSLSTGAVAFFGAPSEAGPWTAGGTIADELWAEPSGLIQLRIGAGLAQAVVSSTGLLVQGAAAAGDVLQVINSTATPTAPNLEVISQAAGDNTVGLHVAGDTNSRLKIDSNGLMGWGTGAAGQDVTLGRTAANVLSLGSGDTLISTVLEAIAAAAANAAIIAEVTGDTNPRFQVLGSGSHQWGPGNAATDTTLARTAAGTLTLTSTLIATLLEAVATAAANAAVIVEVTGDTNPRAQILGNGHIQFGTGAAAVDVTLQRNAGHLDVAATDGNTYSAERLTVVNTGQTITSVSPTLTALTGLTASVASGTTYRFRLWVSYQGSAAAGAPVFQVTGPATSTSIGQRVFTTNGATATVGQAGSGLNSSQTGPTFQTAAQQLTWEGIITPSANGTLGVSGATNTSGDNLVINGAALDLFPVI